MLKAFESREITILTPPLLIQNSEITFTCVEEQQAGDCMQVPERNHHFRTMSMGSRVRGGKGLPNL